MINFLLVLLVFFSIIYLSVKLTERTIPKPIVTPPVYSGEDRHFRWVCSTLSNEFSFSITVKINSENCAVAKQEFIVGEPSKVTFFSNEQYFEVSKLEINHVDFGYSSQEIQQVSRYLQQEANTLYLSEYELASLVLSFTQEQCIKYMYDIESTGYHEYCRFPVETIADTVGDCDCKAVLACSLFKALNYKVAFTLMPGHAAVAISLDGPMPYANFFWNNRAWYYCETTGENWVPGHIPGGMSVSEMEFKEI